MVVMIMIVIVIVTVRTILFTVASRRHDRGRRVRASKRARPSASVRADIPGARDSPPPSSAPYRPPGKVPQC